MFIKVDVSMLFRITFQIKI